MKLLRYTYWKLFPFLFLLLAVWGVLFYITILEEVTDETDDSLENYRNILVNSALRDSTILYTRGNPMTMYNFRSIDPSEAHHYKEVFYDSTVYIEIEDEYEPVRVMKSCFMMPSGQYYELELKLSTLEREDMVEAILSYLLALFMLMFISMVIIVRIVLKKAFSPLDKLMLWLRKIQPDAEVPPLENNTQIKEFEELSAAALDMGNRSHKAYCRQKQFVENASHELQTPLAIACNKIELLAESDSLTEAQMHELSEVYATLHRAVHLNKSLLLLTRIENRQYVETETVQPHMLMREIVDELTEIYEDKNLAIDIAVHAPFTIQCNQTLMRILLTNLLKNAFVHTPAGGRLLINVTATTLELRNSGHSPLDADRIFERFHRAQTTNKESVGLGLSIARSIAHASGLTLSYKWDGMHCFELKK